MSETERRFDQAGLKTILWVRDLLLGKTGLALNELKSDLGPWENDVYIELPSAS